MAEYCGFVETLNNWNLDSDRSLKADNRDCIFSF